MIIFYFVCVNFLNAFLHRGVVSLNIDEKICGSTFVIVLAVGIASIEMWSFDFLKLVTIMAILISAYSFSSGTTFFISALLGVGRAILDLNLSYISIFIGFSLIAMGFCGSYRIYSAISIILLDVLFGLYIGVYAEFNFITILPTLISGFIFVIIPKKWLNLFKDRFANRKDKVAIRSLVNRTKAGICKRMNELSQVFKEMDIVFRDMVKGTLNEEDANVMLSLIHVQPAGKPDVSENVC